MPSDGPKIELIADGSDDCPILLISGTDLETSRELLHKIRALRNRIAGSLLIHDVQGFENCRNPELRLEVSEADLGVQRSATGDGYRCALSYDAWIRVENLLAPFCRRDASATGFQWLDESSDISLLFSPEGGW